MTRLPACLLLGAVLGCNQAPEPSAAESASTTTPAAQPSDTAPTRALPAPVPAPPSSVERLKQAEAIWNHAVPLTEARVRSLHAFFHQLPEDDFRAYFGRARADAVTEPKTQLPKLQARALRVTLPVAATRTDAGVYLDDPTSEGLVKFRLVWPLDLGQGVHVVMRKPKINAASGRPMLRPLRTWLFDYRPKAGWLKAVRKDPARLSYRAVMLPVVARTKPVPSLQMRVAMWQVFDGERLLHQETDDR